LPVFSAACLGLAADYQDFGSPVVFIEARATRDVSASSHEGASTVNNPCDRKLQKSSEAVARLLDMAHLVENSG
jgi:hypothetical protein